MHPGVAELASKLLTRFAGDAAQNIPEETARIPDSDTSPEGVKRAFGAAAFGAAGRGACAERAIRA